MGVRKTHNRVKERHFFTEDLELCIRKAKAYYRGEKRFYIFKLNDKYFADSSTLINKNPIMHWICDDKTGIGRWRSLI